MQPRGASGYVRELTLFNTGEPMLEPFTQELPLVTEDELNATQDALSSLGDSPEAHETRARLQVILESFFFISYRRGYKIILTNL